jgi:AcrR family transcriptional regulator
MAGSFDQPRKSKHDFSPASGERTRRGLIEAAAQLVAEVGWDAVTTRQIAQRADANQGLIHYHFGSKEGLLRAAFEVALGETFGEPGAALTDAANLPAAAGEIVRGLDPGEVVEPLALFSVEAMSRAARDQEIRRPMREVLAEFRERVASRIAAGQQRGELPSQLDPAGTATLLGALFDGLGLHVLIDPSIELDRTAETLETLLGGAEGARSSGAY